MLDTRTLASTLIFCPQGQKEQKPKKRTLLAQIYEFGNNLQVNSADYSSPAKIANQKLKKQTRFEFVAREFNKLINKNWLSKEKVRQNSNFLIDFQVHLKHLFLKEYKK